MTSSAGSNTSPFLPDPAEEPLWRRTQLRLQNMATYTAQRMNTSDGFDERIQLQEERIALAGRHLVLLIKEWEDRQAAFGRTLGVD